MSELEFNKYYLLAYGINASPSIFNLFISRIVEPNDEWYGFKYSRIPVILSVKYDSK